MSFLNKVKLIFWKKEDRHQTTKNTSFIAIGDEREFDFESTKQKFETNYDSTDELLQAKNRPEERDNNLYVFGNDKSCTEKQDITEKGDDAHTYGAIPKQRVRNTRSTKSPSRNKAEVPLPKRIHVSKKERHKSLQDDTMETQQKKRKMSKECLIGASVETGFSTTDASFQSSINTFGSKTTGYESDSDSNSSSSPEGLSGQSKMFNRGDTSRQSNLSHSVSAPNLGLASNVYIGHVEHLQHANTGQGNSTNTINTFSSSDRNDIASRVDKQTQALFDTLNSVEIKVSTEIFTGAEEYLHRHSKKKLVILKGSHFGCKFAAKMLIEKLIKTNPNSKAYVLENPMEWSVIEQEDKAFVLIHDISGTTFFNRSRLDEFARVLEQNLLPFATKTGKITIILTMRDFSEEDTQQITDKYQDYVIDAKKKEFRPSDDTKEELVRSFIRQYNVKTNSCEINRNKGNIVSHISEETMKGIVLLLGNIGYIRTLDSFFSLGLDDGLMFIRKPTKSYVRKIRNFAESKHLSFITLLAVYDHEGLGPEAMDHMKKLNEMPVSRKYWFSIENGLNTLSKGKWKRVDNKKYKHDIRKQSNERQMLFTFALEHQVLSNNIADAIYREARRFEGTFLEEKNEIYRFATEAVKHSFLVVCCEIFPAALETCDDVFFYDCVKPSKFLSSDDHDSYFYIDLNEKERCQAFATRLKEEMVSGKVARCMSHEVMTVDFFRYFVKLLCEKKRFINFLGEKKHWLWLILKATDEKEKASCLVYGIDHEEGGKTITDIILEDGLWMEKREKEKWREFTRIQEQKAIIRAAEKSKTKSFESLTDLGVGIPFEAFIKAIEATALDIIDLILHRGNCNRKDKCKALLHALEFYICPRGQRASDTALDIFRKISSEVSINYKEEGVESLIHYAAARKDSRMLKVLLEGKRLLGDSIDVDLVSTKAETALTIATKSQLPENITMLLKHGANQRLTENTETRPIFIACQAGQIDIVKILIDAHPYIFREKNADGMCPLMVAALHGRPETVKFLLDRCYGNIDMKDDMCKGALHIAAREGHLLIVDKLINAGFSPTEVDELNETPLSLACQSRKHSTARRLLKAMSGQTTTEPRIMIRAIQAEDKELIQLLLEFDFTLNFIDVKYGTPLFVVTHNRLHCMLKYILERGADSKITQDGSQPIHIAGEKGDITAIRILQQHGADIGVKQTITGETVLHISVSKKHLNFIKKLFTLPECKELLDEKNLKGETALHLASRNGSCEIVKCLLRAGASPMIISKRGQLPRHLAELKKKEISVKETELWNAYCDIEKMFENPKLYAGVGLEENV